MALDFNCFLPHRISIEHQHYTSHHSSANSLYFFSKMDNKARNDIRGLVIHMSNYGADHVLIVSQKWNLNEIPDLRGKVALVTGAKQACILNPYCNKSNNEKLFRWHWLPYSSPNGP
jgi:hypothetical protein